MKARAPPSSPERHKQLPGWLGWVAGLIGVSSIIRYFYPDGEFFNPPYCAWRFIGNGDAWNVAAPDTTCIYHVMQLRIGEHDMFKLVAESLPYARYASYQTYDLPYFMSLMSLRDVDIITDNGTNAYSNLTAAVLGEKQGGYTVYITPHGNHNLTNELRALPDQYRSGHFDLFFRIYVQDGPPPPQAPLAHLPPGGEEDADKWGWAPPPRLYVRRGKDGQWREIPMCKYRRRKGFKWVPYLTELLHTAWFFHGDKAPNRHNNVFLPKYSDRKAMLASKDAHYMAALADASTPGQRLFARVTGKWPRTASSLYSPPYIANFSDYHVRYASISTGSRKPPYRTTTTLSDSTVNSHYRERRGEAWDGRFVVWMVPPEVVMEQLPTQVLEDKDAILLPWGQDPWTGRSLVAPGVLFRQVMAQSQVLAEQQQPAIKEGGEDSLPPHPSGFVNVVPESCDAHRPRAGAGRKRRRRRWEQDEQQQEEGGGEAASERQCEEQGSCASSSSGSCGEEGAEEVTELCEEQEDPHGHAALEHQCCGASSPPECFSPGFVAYRLGDYYPRIEYFVSSDDDSAHTLTRLRDEEGQVLHPTPSSAA